MGGEDVEVWVKDEVIAEGMDGGGGREAAVPEVEDGAKGVAQAGSGGVKKVGEQVSTFAENATDDFGDGKNKLAVGDRETDVVSDPPADWRVRRWWQAGQRWRALQEKARRRSWPQSVQRRRVKPAARSPQREKA